MIGRITEYGEEKKDESYKVYNINKTMKESGYKNDYLEENIREKTDIVVDKTMKEKDMNDITTDKAMESMYQDLVVGKTMEERDMNDITTDKAIPDYMYAVYLASTSRWNKKMSPWRLGWYKRWTQGCTLSSLIQVEMSVFCHRVWQNVAMKSNRQEPSAFMMRKVGPCVSKVCDEPSFTSQIVVV